MTHFRRVSSLVCAFAVLCVVLGAPAGARAEMIVVHFDDLVGDNFPVPNGYGGINWLGQWTYYGFAQFPYTPHSPPNRIYAPFGPPLENPFDFVQPDQLFLGAWFSGTSDTFVQFRLYDDGVLVHTSAQLTMSATPTFLASGYSGPVDRVGVFTNQQLYVMDDVTYDNDVIPEPATVTLLGVGAVGLAGFAWRRRRERKR